MLKIEGKTVFQMGLDQDVLERNQSYPVRCNSIILKNAGTTSVRINNLWTMSPGDTLSLGITSDIISVYEEDFLITFIGDRSNTNGNNRLEVIQQILHHPDLAHYVDQSNHRRI